MPEFYNCKKFLRQIPPNLSVLDKTKKMVPAKKDKSLKIIPTKN